MDQTMEEAPVMAVKDKVMADMDQQVLEAMEVN